MGCVQLVPKESIIEPRDGKATSSKMSSNLRTDLEVISFRSHLVSVVKSEASAAPDYKMQMK